MRRLICVVIAAAVASLALASPSSAAPGGPPAKAKGGPAAYCSSVYETMTNPVSGQTYPQYILQVEFTFGGETFVEPFGVASFQACVSTVASAMRSDGTVPGDSLTRPAYLAQCDLLEDFGVISYPYDFYGLYPAENRADCATILKGVHTGELALPAAPPVG